MFTNGPGDRGSIPGRAMPKKKKKKKVLNASLLNTQHYMVWIKGKVEQSREWSCTLLYTCVVAIEKEAFGSPSTKVPNLTYFLLNYILTRQLTTNNQHHKKLIIYLQIN